VIGESYLTGNSALANNATVSIGAAFNVGGAHDLVFRYGQLASSTTAPSGDYNGNGSVDAADYVAWREKLGQNVTLPNDTTPGTVTPADYEVWRANFGISGGSAGASVLTTGLVRYVTSGLGGSAAVPEPHTMLLVGVGLGTLLVGTRRKALEN
jgi:hypothetical protein